MSLTSTGNRTDRLAAALDGLDLGSEAPCRPKIVLGCSAVPPLPPAGIKYTEMDASQKRAVVVAILMGHRDEWGAWEGSCVRVVTPASS